MLFDSISQDCKANEHGFRYWLCWFSYRWLTLSHHNAWIFFGELINVWVVQTNFSSDSFRYIERPIINESANEVSNLNRILHLHNIREFSSMSSSEVSRISCSCWTWPYRKVLSPDTVGSWRLRTELILIMSCAELLAWEWAFLYLQSQSESWRAVLDNWFKTCF